MQPYYIYYYRNIPNLSADDTPYIIKMIDNSIESELILIKYYESVNGNKDTIYNKLIKDAKSHINILKTIYGNLSGKSYNKDKTLEKNIDSVKSAIIENIELSKMYRKILYYMKNQVHRYMLFDIIIDNINNSILLNMLMNETVKWPFLFWLMILIYIYDILLL